MFENSSTPARSQQPKTKTVTQLQVGRTASVGGYEVLLNSVAKENGPNYETIIGRFGVSAGGKTIDDMIAERRYYPFPGSETTEAGIRVRPLDVLYITLGEQAPSGAWTVRMYYHPLVAWIWAGCLVMVLGGVLSLSDRRLRVGAPRRAAAPAASPLPAE